MKGHAARRAARDARLNEEFARLCGEACAAGRVQKDCTLSAKRAGLFGTLCTLPFAAAAAVLYVFFAPRVLLATGSLFFEPLLLAAALLALVPLHEGVHALASAAVHRSFYGIRLRVLGTPQCVCLRFANRAQYAVAALAPFVLLGLAPAAAGIATGCLPALVCGAFGCIAAGADLLVAFLALRAGKGAVLLDHPARCGFAVFSPKCGGAENSFAQEVDKTCSTEYNKKRKHGGK